MNASIITSSSNSAASLIAGATPSSDFTSVSPTVDPCFEGFTMRGIPTFSGSVAMSAGVITQGATGTPARAKSFLERSLSIASALASGPLPV